MSDIALRVEGLGKRYRIGIQENGAGGMYRYKSLRDSFGGIVRRPLHTLRQTVLREPMNQDNSFWALKDINFEVKKGEVVGIIGRNGAGKSTLLKILSQITKPTTGKVDLFGRVGSLLEVGTGFHPELTGRENIYLNGAILGMTRAEVKSRFDEIVAFSEVEKFLDTPVKHYSSGMYTRLAFAVAAHLDSEILVVDEVLAVGDASFQKKCLGKMETIGSGGRAVVFVSHSMPTVARLCRQATCLSQGEVAYTGSVGEATRCYLEYGAQRAAERVWESPTVAPGDSTVRLYAVRARDSLGRISDRLSVAHEFTIEVEYEQLRKNLGAPLTVSIHLVNEAGVVLFATNDFNNEEWYLSPRRVGRVRTRCHLPANFLAEGTVSVLAAVCTYDPNCVHAIERDAVVLQMIEDADCTGRRALYFGDWPGVVRPALQWEASYVS